MFKQLGCKEFVFIPVYILVKIKLALFNIKSVNEKARRRNWHSNDDSPLHALRALKPEILKTLLRSSHLSVEIITNTYNLYSLHFQVNLK